MRFVGLLWIYLLVSVWLGLSSMLLSWKGCPGTCLKRGPRLTANVKPIMFVMSAKASQLTFHGPCAEKKRPLKVCILCCWPLIPHLRSAGRPRASRAGRALRLARPAESETFAFDASPEAKAVESSLTENDQRLAGETSATWRALREKESVFGSFGESPLK